MPCNFCKELNEEKEEIEIDEIYIRCAGHFYWDCPIRYCPNCGDLLKKYKPKEDAHA